MIEQLNNDKEKLILKQKEFKQAQDMSIEFKNLADKLINDLNKTEKLFLDNSMELFKGYGGLSVAIFVLITLLGMVGIIPSVSTWMLLPSICTFSIGGYKIFEMYKKNKFEMTGIQKDIDENVYKYITTSEKAHSLGKEVIIEYIKANKDLASAETSVKLAERDLEFPNYEYYLSNTSERKNKKRMLRKKDNK